LQKISPGSKEPKLSISCEKLLPGAEERCLVEILLREGKAFLCLQLDLKRPWYRVFHYLRTRMGFQ